MVTEKNRETKGHPFVLKLQSAGDEMAGLRERRKITENAEYRE